MLGGIDELAIQARAFIDQDSLDAQSLLAHENEITGSQSKRCPMCKKMVDDEYLRKFKGLSTQKARDILNDSVGLGEMVHEDIKDVVKRRVRGSDDDEDFD
ncbi:hypothetical protein M7I_0240 [Glarea lozoyensis 74030]|uniref:Uncharacterized protein n=1 Tax=Glarea lozoyensis (strain ATCC 74030 / MF5533) TaxID=1104152 RepID=H0ECU5_GLAL7|nr:hypothetical protein M7I_0240 [Glarea lozoyensis 74030]